jgi:hypothetical protein
MCLGATYGQQALYDEGCFIGANVSEQRRLWCSFKDRADRKCWAQQEGRDDRKCGEQRLQQYFLEGRDGRKYGD